MSKTLCNTFPQLIDVIEYVRIAHEGQSRMHGGPYFLHPIAVAEILHDQFGINDIGILTAALCHDLIEDTGVTYSELGQMYGYRVASIVLALSKPHKSAKDERSRELRARDNYSKFLAASEDVQTIKIADRIHNLSELKFAPQQFVEQYIRDTEILMAYLSGPHMNDLRYAFDKARKLLTGPITEGKPHGHEGNQGTGLEAGPEAQAVS